jgi:hypothetical protein
MKVDRITPGWWLAERVCTSQFVTYRGGGASASDVRGDNTAGTWSLLSGYSRTEVKNARGILYLIPLYAFMTALNWHKDSCKF